jgi:DNA ligase-associated metallophosphoesterase
MSDTLPAGPVPAPAITDAGDALGDTVGAVPGDAPGDAVVALPAGAIALQVAGASLVLLPSRALWWPAQDLLLVADLHLGKAASLRQQGIVVPGGSGAATLARLDAALAVSGAAQLMVLGDLLHARVGRTPQLDQLVGSWLEQHPGLRWSLLVGNHDRAAGVPANWRLESIAQGEQIGPFVLHHHPQPSPDGYVLCGHTHPAVRLAGPGRQRARLPCFWFGTAVGVLPAFGELTGHFEVRPARHDRVCVLAGDTVVEVAAGPAQPIGGMSPRWNW